MFIFDENDRDLEYCSLQLENDATQTIIGGLAYLDYFFIPVESYSKDELGLAIQQCKEFLEGENPQNSIIVESETEITVWINDKQLKRIAARSC